MSPLRFFAALSAAIIVAGSAAAQGTGSRIIVEPATQPAPRQEGSVRVQSNINLFMPGPTGEGDASQALRDRARRTIYEMAAHECDLLREVLAKDCRLESVNTNINRQWGQQQQEGYNVGGSMSLQITLK
jgi:hypothetical protein